MLRKLEEERQVSAFWAKIWMIPVMLIALAAAKFMHSRGETAAMVGMIFVGLIFSAFVYRHFISKVAKDFKEQVLPILLEDVDPSLSYIVDNGIELDEFNEAGLFQHPDRFTGKDLITGNIGQVEVQFSLVHAQEKRVETTTDSDGSTTTQTTYETLFSGLFFIADFNKHFAGRTLVKQKKFDLFNKLFGSPVLLEDPEFNNMFTVYATDQVEARYIMTPSLMEKFKILHSKVGSFQACFSHGRLLMAIEMPQDFFEPLMSKSLTDSVQLQKIVFNLRLITGIVEDLGLNVRIWGAKTGS
ncbi:DUF3137 domain-containing protein [Solimicrobium silvestre]|uniref:DUF3137 domain-containing protein n=1 Tax=Solimicrobium silvestre TaxID=2099400 RepID=A0A2S9H029_9BURK|nr:DUF3137 domain-containing protein [Solimicrobium silvestre]PRC93226.1 hypothetical protein S2091_1964 [Solimicrobium silvestre]